MQCLQDRAPLPSFIVEFSHDEELAERDFEAPFTNLLIRTCELLSTHKAAGCVNNDLAADARMLMVDWQLWRPRGRVWGPGDWPPAALVSHTTDIDTIHQIVWLGMAYLTSRGILVLISDLLIEHAEIQHRITPTPTTSLALSRATQAQLVLCERLQERVVYHMKDFAASEAVARTMGAQGLLWPLSSMLGVRTTTAERLMWCAGQASRIAELFGLRQAKIVVDLIMMGVGAAAGGLGLSEDLRAADGVE
jgi:hypothetical protein